MKKRNLFVLLTILLSSCIITNVSALESEQNIEQSSLKQKFLKEAPSELVELYNEENFNISPNWFSDNGKISSNIKLMTQYIKTNVKLSKGKAVDTQSEIITKDEYYSPEMEAQATRAVIGNCTLQSSMYNDCWETNAKRITIAYQTYPRKSISVINTWKSIPSVKSYDTIGIYHAGRFNVSSAEGWQYYDGSNQYYSSNSGNMKISSNGVSLSQNIIDNVSGSLSNELWVYGTFNSNIMQLTASYQHAVTNISLETSKNFNFSGDGMGRVFNWNTSWSQWDNMRGVCANISSNYLWYC